MKEKKEINTKTKIEGEEENTDIKSKVAKPKSCRTNITAVIAVVFFVIIVCLGLIVQIFPAKAKFLDIDSTIYSLTVWSLNT